MAGKIKGITIEFDGDTTKLGNALKKVNEQAKGVDKDLRAVNKALKFNPKSTELIAQKQTLLRQKIKQTQGQLEAFKAAESQMRASGADENSQEFMELRRNIIEAESKLKHFNAELEKTKRAKFDQLSKSFKDVGSKMQTVGQGMTKYITGPIVGLGVASVKAFNEVKNGLNIVAQKTGATGKALKDMQDSARNLAKTIPTDFESAGTAIGEVNTRFGVTGDTLESLSAQFIKFAKVNDSDLNTSIDQTQKALAAFGKSGKDAPALLDALTRAAQKSGANTDTLTAGLIQNAAAFKEMGLSANESVYMMAAIEKSGANSETVMQGLRKALKNATKDGIPLNKALADLQNTIKNGKGNMDGLTASYDLFGKSGDQVYNAVKNGTIDFQNLSLSAEQAKGSLDRVFNETLTPSEKFQTSLNTVKDSGYILGSSLLEILAPALEKVANGAARLAEWWQTLSPETQDTIIKVGLLVAAIGPLIVVLGKIATGVGALINIIPLLTSPVGLAVAAFAGLVAAGVAIYKNWDTIKKKAKQFKDKIVGIFESLHEKLSNIWQKIKDFFTIDIELPSIGGGGSIAPYNGGLDWYADGGIVKSPKIVGVGEAGPEAIIPLDKLNTMMYGVADSIVNGVATTSNMRGGNDIVIPIYLYPSGPKMGEQIVKSYDTYKGQLG